MKYWSEPRAWRYLAIAFGKRLRPDKTGKIVTRIFGREVQGICFAIDVLEGNEKIAFDTASNMRSWIRAEFYARRCVDFGSYLYFPHTRAGHRKRAALCKRFAKESLRMW